MIMPTDNNRKEKLYAYVEDGYLYYPQYMGDRSNEENHVYKLNMIKVDISDNKVINVGIEETKLFFISEKL